MIGALITAAIISYIVGLTLILIVAGANRQ